MITKRRRSADSVKAGVVHRHLLGRVALIELNAAGIGKVHAAMAIGHQVVHAVAGFVD